MTRTSTPQRARRVRLPAAERRSQILRIARELFVAEGIERTSMRRIADRAGITPTAIYDHFADKQALLVAIADEFFDGLLAAMADLPAPPSDPLDGLRAMMRCYVRHGLAHPEQYRLVFMTPLGGFKRGGHRPPPPGEEEPGCPTGSTRGAQTFALLEAEIDRLLAGGAVRGGAKEAISESIWALGHGIVSLLITHDEFQFTPVDQLLEAAIQVLLFGVAARPADRA